MRGNHSFSRSLAVGLVIVSFAFVIAMVAGVGRVRAHDAPSGWSYPSNCCSDYDCREVPADWVEERPEGYRIVITGEVIPMTSRKVRNSPDGKFHWCSVAGRDDGSTICLFAPPRGY